MKQKRTTYSGKYHFLQLMARYAWTGLYSFQTYQLNLHERQRATPHHILFFSYSLDPANCFHGYRPKVSSQPGITKVRRTKVRSWSRNYHLDQPPEINHLVGDWHTSVLANSGTPTTAWSCGDKLLNLAKPPLFLTFSVLSDLNDR